MRPDETGIPYDNDEDNYVEAREAIEAEATARRYGGHCKVCGVLRDYHKPSMQNALHVGTVNHEFQRR